MFTIFAGLAEYLLRKRGTSVSKHLSFYSAAAAVSYVTLAIFYVLRRGVF